MPGSLVGRDRHPLRRRREALDGVEELLGHVLVRHRADRPCRELALVRQQRRDHGRVLRQDVAMPLGDGDGGQDVGRGIRPHDEVDLVLADEPLVELRHLRLVGLVVEDRPFDRPSEQAAVLVELLDELLTRDLVNGAGRREGTGEGERRADHDGFARWLSSGGGGLTGRAVAIVVVCTSREDHGDRDERRNTCQ